MRKFTIFFSIVSLSILLGIACNTVEKKSDAQLTAEVKDRIKADRVLSSADIRVNSEDGVVKLYGRILSQEEAERALNLARSVPGVKNVTSELKVDEQATNSVIENRVSEGEETAREQREEMEGERADIIDDATITTRVKMKLAEDKTVSALRINVDTRNQVVTLTGTVRNDAEARRAVQIAESVKDVKDVNSVLTVRSSS